jgi:hypothetical protein
MQYGIPVLGIMVIGMAVLHTTWTLNLVTWYGILDEIQVIKINDNSLELNGIFKFKIGDDINISNGTSLTFKILLVSEEDTKPLLLSNIHI